MPDEIKVNTDKFDRILGNMLKAKPLSKAEISARIKSSINDKETARKLYLAKRAKIKQEKLGQ